MFPSNPSPTPLARHVANLDTAASIGRCLHALLSVCWPSALYQWLSRRGPPPLRVDSPAFLPGTQCSFYRSWVQSSSEIQACLSFSWHAARFWPRRSERDSDDTGHSMASVKRKYGKKRHSCCRANMVNVLLDSMLHVAFAARNLLGLVWLIYTQTLLDRWSDIIPCPGGQE